MLGDCKFGGRWALLAKWGVITDSELEEEFK
jgi:hypothetical protein